MLFLQKIFCDTKTQESIQMDLLCSQHWIIVCGISALSKQNIS